MANKPSTPATNSSLKQGLFILLVFLVIGAGSFGIWRVLRPKTPEDTNDGTSNKTQEKPPITGRQNATNRYTAEQLAWTALNAGNNKNTNNNSGGGSGSGSGSGNDAPPPPPPKAVWIDSKEGEQLIKERTERIQMNTSDLDFLRAKYEVGRSLVDTQSFTADQMKAIDKLFSQVVGVISGDYLTYPIYGRYERDGAALQRDLKTFLDKDWRGYNLTDTHRHGGDAHWLGSISLNLIYGNQNSHVHTGDQIWWYKADREGLDWYKQMNGHNVEDKRLPEVRNGIVSFAAGGAYMLAKKWLKECEYLDQICELEAKEALLSEGLLTRQQPEPE